MATSETFRGHLRDMLGGLLLAGGDTRHWGIGDTLCHVGCTQDTCRTQDIFLHTSDTGVRREDTWEMNNTVGRHRMTHVPQVDPCLDGPARLGVGRPASEPADVLLRDLRRRLRGGAPYTPNPQPHTLTPNPQTLHPTP